MVLLFHSCSNTGKIKMWSILICSVFVFVLQNASANVGKAPRVALNDGILMPQLGLGTFLGFDEKGQITPKGQEVEDAVKWALAAGYRMIDTAAVYQDEEHIGRAIAESEVPRKDIFLVTKLASHEARDVVAAAKRSLGRLNMTYVDLYLIHNPVSLKPENHDEFDIIDYLDTWKGMEEVKKLGLAKSIGISNFNVSQIERLLQNCDVKPSVLQVEVNLNLAQDKLLSLCKKNNIAVMAYTPFGSLFDKSAERPPPRSTDPTLAAIADKYKKTVPQIVLRYLVQRGTLPIPKSLHKNRIEENINIFDFELSKEEMDTLAKFNKDYRVVHPSFWQDHPYYPFERVDKPIHNIFKGKKD